MNPHFGSCTSVCVYVRYLLTLVHHPLCTWTAISLFIVHDPPTSHANHCVWTINLPHHSLCWNTYYWHPTHSMVYPTTPYQYEQSWASGVFSVCGIHWWVPGVLWVVYSHGQLLCLGTLPVLSTVCSLTWSVMSTQCLLNLASPVHSVCSLTWSILCTLCVYMYPASLVHSVCSISYLVLCTTCVPLVTQSCAPCVFH